jgi:hypothetical protein
MHSGTNARTASGWAIFSSDFNAAGSRALRSGSVAGAATIAQLCHMDIAASWRDHRPQTDARALGLESEIVSRSPSRGVHQELREWF